MKFSGKVVSGPVNKWLNLVANRITVWIQGLFSGFVTVGRYGKWLTDINLLLILIRQMHRRCYHRALRVREPSISGLDFFETELPT